MTQGAQAALLPDGRRLHLHHGPIDLIVEVIGAPREAAYARAVDRSETLLSGLVEELPALRRPLERHAFADPVARRMARAVRPFAETFVTPMAAVAGAVADEVLAALVADADIPKAYVNNGGDIAFHLGPRQTVTSLSPAGDIEITENSPSRGLATSGWRGRSHSLGIADAVTVAAQTAAAADVAATLIANAVDLPGHSAIHRVPASDLSPDSDLGGRLVTMGVAPLTSEETNSAIARGLVIAKDFVGRGLIHEAVLALNGFAATTVTSKESTLIHA